MLRRLTRRWHASVHYLQHPAQLQTVSNHRVPKHSNKFATSNTILMQRQVFPNPHAQGTGTFPSGFITQSKSYVLRSHISANSTLPIIYLREARRRLRAMRFTMLYERASLQRRCSSLRLCPFENKLEIKYFNGDL